MNTNFQIQVNVHNYDGESFTYTKNITLKDIIKFAVLIETINKNVDNVHWNWFSNGLPTKWEGDRFVLDSWLLCKKMEENFNYKVEDINYMKEFYLRFTPNGADRIENIKLFKLEEFYPENISN